MQSKGLWIGVGAVAVALLIAGYFLFFNKEKPQSGALNITPIVTPTPTPTVEGEGDVGVVREITVEAEEFSYSTEGISVKKGEKVKLTLVNNGRMSHNFVVGDTDIQTSLAGAGKSVSVEFSLDEVGTYTFYCSVGNHRALGMEGSLEVTE